MLTLDTPIKEAGSSLGYSKRRTLSLWATIKDKLSGYYARKLKSNPQAQPQLPKPQPPKPTPEI